MGGVPVRSRLERALRPWIGHPPPRRRRVVRGRNQSNRLDCPGRKPERDRRVSLTTALPRLHLRQVAVAVRHDSEYEAPPEEGDWLSGLAGSGNVIAVSSWTTGFANSISNGRLILVGTRALKPIVSGPGAIVAESVDAGRIAVVRSMALWPSHYRLSGGAGSVGV